MVPRLFPETTDIIIDFLHEDKEALSSCGLTCRAWLASSRYHLFSDVTVYPANGQSFIELLISPLNNISHIVRHLTCALEQKDAQADVHARGELSTEVLMMIPDITHLARAIKSLTLRHLDWSQYTPANLRLILSNLKNCLEALELTSVTIYGLDEAITVISAFPRLKSLSLNRFGWSEYPFGPPTSTATYPRRRPFVIKFLNLEYPPPVALLDWLKNPVPKLHAVQLPYVVNGISRTPELVRSAGASIQKLEVLFNTAYENIGRQFHLCLPSQLRKVSTLTRFSVRNYTDH